MRFLDAVLELLATANPHVVILYGRKGGRDVDLLAIIQEDRQIPWKLGKLDLLAIGLSSAKELARLNDPVVLEPIRTGQVLCGSVELVSEMESDASSGANTESAVLHNLNRSREESLSAWQWYRRSIATEDPSCVEIALLNMTYRRVYYLTAAAIASHRPAPSFGDLLEIDEQLKDGRKLLSEVKDGCKPSTSSLRATLMALDIEESFYGVEHSGSRRTRSARR